MDVLARLRQAIGSVPLLAAADDVDDAQTGSNVNSSPAPRSSSSPSSSSSIAPASSEKQKPSTPSSIRKHGGRSGTSRRSDKSSALAFRDNWLAIRAILANPDQSALHHGVSRTDLAVRLQTLCDALVFESNRADEEADIAGPCMEMLLEGDMLGQLVKWTANDRVSGSQSEVVRLFASLIILQDERFLSRQAVHRPLVRLMRICVGDEFFSSNTSVLDSERELDSANGSAGLNEDEEKRAHRRFGRMGSAEALGFEEQLVDLMCHIASRLRNTPELLIIFFRERGGDEQTRRAFNIAMSGSSTGTPSRASTRAPSPSGTSSPNMSLTPASGTRTSQPAVSSPLRPTDSLPLPVSLPLQKGGSSSQASSSPGLAYDFPLFSYLMRFVHRESRTGELARAGILFLVDVAFAPGRRNLARSMRTSPGKNSLGRAAGHASLAAMGSPRSLRPGPRRSGASTPQKARVDVDLGIGPSISLARFMLESDFAEVLGAGVGAVYGLLPTKLAISSKQQGSNDNGESTVRQDSAKAEATLVGQGEAMILGLGDQNGQVMVRNAPLSSSEEVRSQARLLCDLLEFTQDILRTTARVAHAGGVVPGIDEAKRQTISLELSTIARSLTLSMASNIQTLFLENILYPSMLECSDVDSSSVAVMTYLDTILSVLETETALADCIIGWLVGTESYLGKAADDGRRTRKQQKHKSTAMLQLEKEKGGPTSREASSYFSDVLGRYTIRDLLVDNLQSTTSAMARTAGLRLASTLFTFHGSFTLTNVIRVDLDDFATAFPTHFIALEEENRAEADKVTGSDDAFALHDDDDSEEFVYPGGAKDDEQFDARLKQMARTTVGGANSLQVSKEMELYVSLIRVIEQGGIGESKSNANQIDEATSQSTGFDNYLDDAEMGITQDSLFRMVMREMSEEADTAANGLTAIAAGQAGFEKADGGEREFSLALPSRACFRHRLNAHDRLLRNVLVNLCGFWQNRPEVNVALTGFLAVLAMCPLRSMEGFLTFPRSKGSQEITIEDDSAIDITVAHDDDADSLDDRSDDERAFAKRSRAGAPGKDAKRAAKEKVSVPSVNLKNAEAPIVICILRSLVAQLEYQRREIEDFDRYLDERRRGLLFVENLNDALRLSDLVSSNDVDGKDDGSVLATPLNVFASSKTSSSENWNAFVDVAHVEPVEAPKTNQPLRKTRISLPPPPSATPSQGLPNEGAAKSKAGESTENGYADADAAAASKPLSERSAFARFFGRPSSKPAATTSKATTTPSNGDEVPKDEEKAQPPPKPFAQHYLQTAGLVVDVNAIRLSKASPWSLAFDANAAAEVRATSQADEGAGVKKRTRFKDAGSDSETETFIYPGAEEIAEAQDENGKGKRSGRERRKKGNARGTANENKNAALPPPMTLSTMLDNVVILEEAIKELVAILQVRRAMGIDAISFAE